jgi:c-di-GMP-binding flagellar brake protein YcgR
VDILDVPYGSSPTPTIVGNSGNATVTYKYKTQGAADNTYATYTPGTTILPLGNYTIKAIVPAANGWNAWTSTMNFSVVKAEGTVTERFKKDNFYLMKSEITGDIVKFQRREFYRMECSIPLLFLSLEDDEGEAEKMAEVKEMIKDTTRPVAVRGLGTVLDISGGGMKIITEKDLEDINYLFLHFEVLLNNKKTNLEVVAHILGKEYNPDNKKYLYRMKFLFKDTKIQERIIRYIFEEERRNRHKKLE